MRSGRTFELELERPPGFLFQAGQSVRVFVGGEGRDYSLASDPAASSLRLLVRLLPQGAVSMPLSRLPIGTPLQISGPHGFFTFKPSDRPAVWAATGVGIAPFVSMVRSGVRGFILLHGVRDADELCDRVELENAARRYVPCLTRGEAPGCYPGRVTGWARDQLAPGGYDFWLCGSRQMIRDFTLLADERFPDSRVYTEIFF